MTRKPAQKSSSQNQTFSDWVNQGLKHARWPISRVLQMGVLIAICAAVAVLYLVQSSQIVTTTRHVDSLREQLATLQRENAELTLQISAAGSVEQLKQRAQALGFEPAQTVMYLPVQALPADDAPAVQDVYSH
jgi:cell division protein FtsL